MYEHFLSNYKTSFLWIVLVAWWCSNLIFHPTTTGAGCFAEGPRLSAKSLRPSAKPLLSAALGKAPSAKIRSAKSSLPRAVYRALGKAFAESPTLGKARNKKNAKKTWKNFFNRGRGPLASHGIFRAKFVATRLAGFELVTSPSRDTSFATCTTRLYAVSVTQILY
jgi:hypothetical protein